MDWANSGWLTLWLEGLTPEADAGNTIVHIGGIPHRPHSVNPATGQINLILRPVVGIGPRQLWVEHRGIRANPVDFTVTGTPPSIYGLTP